MTSPRSTRMDLLTNLAPANFLGAALLLLLRAALHIVFGTALRAGSRDFFMINPLGQDSLRILKVGFLQPVELAPTSATQTNGIPRIVPVFGPELGIVRKLRTVWII